jgi:hypothetical protein
MGMTNTGPAAADPAACICPADHDVHIGHTDECEAAWCAAADAIEAAAQDAPAPAPRALAGLIVEGDTIALTCPTRAAEVVLVEHDGIRVRWIVRDLATGSPATVTRLWGKFVPVVSR